MMLKKRNSYSKMKDSREEDSSNLRATANSKHPNTQTDNDSIDQQKEFIKLWNSIINGKN